MNKNSIPCNINVEELSISEHIELSAKFNGLSTETRELITKHYGGDVELAEQYAHRAMRENAHPPRWVYELAGPRQGWYEMHRFNR